MPSTAETIAIIATAATAVMGGVAALVRELVLARRELRAVKAAPPPSTTPRLTSLPSITTERAPDLPRVLFVDDEPQLAKVTAHLLRRAGYAVDIAATAEDALRIAQIHHYDFVISDHFLPGMSGLVLLEKLRDLEDGRRQRRILMSAAFVGDGTDAATFGVEGKVDALIAKGAGMSDMMIETMRALRGTWPAN